MRINIGKLPEVLYDEMGNSYEPKKMIPTGKSVTMRGKHGGWQYVIGNYMIRVVL